MAIPSTIIDFLDPPLPEDSYLSPVFDYFDKISQEFVVHVCHEMFEQPWKFNYWYVKR